MDSIVSLLGLALKAGRLSVGEESVGAACRTKKASVLLLASDAADNTIRRALHFSEAGKVLCLTLPMEKQALGRSLGRTSCAMLAVTEIGLAATLAEKLARLDPDTYGAARDTLSKRAQRARRRRKKKREKKSSSGR